MFILNYIKQRAQRRAENKRIAIDARTYKEQEIANIHSGFSLSQIIDITLTLRKNLRVCPSFFVAINVFISLDYIELTNLLVRVLKLQLDMKRCLH